MANFAAWGGYCRAIAGGLRRRYGVDDKAVGFFDLFATPVPEFEEQSLAAVAASLGPDRPSKPWRAGWPGRAHGLSFWNTLAASVE